MSDIVKRLRADAEGWEHAQHTLTGPFIATLERDAADEIEQLREIRETLIKALMIATGATREAIEAAPYSNAYRAAEHRTATLSE